MTAGSPPDRAGGGPEAPARRSTGMIAAAVVAVVVASMIPFFWATTFFTDDHLLLAFARYAPNPLVAFVRDQHGGEFYRPLSMSLWWLLARIGGGTIWPFALVGAALHVVVSVEVALLLVSLGRGRRVAWTGAAFFFLSCETRETALWAAAFPDLLATATVLGALVTLRRGRPVLSALLAATSFFTKESAIVLPVLGLFLGLLPARAAGGVATGRVPSRRLLLSTVVVHALLALAYLAARWTVLRGWGGTGDERAPLAGKVLQIASGLVHCVAGIDVFPEALAWGSGVAFLSVSSLALARRLRAEGVTALAPVVFVAIAILPLFGAGWIVGARYFYLPAVGLAWLAGQTLARASAAPSIAGAVLMLILGGIQTLVRHDQVTAYDRRVAAARRAVIDGVARGHRVFHVAGGIKDLDLAVKEAPALRPFEDQILVLGDVPASFVSIPDPLASAAAILVAVPSLPPSGAYRFGSHSVVGLARRGDEPTLDEVLARFPALRFIRLRPTPGGRVVARDVTEEIRESLD